MCLQIFLCLSIVYRSSSEISLGCEVENLTLKSGLIKATSSSNAGNPIMPFSFFQLYESTFCPRRVTSLYPLSNNSFTSLITDSGFLLLSAPVSYTHLRAHETVLDL